MIKVLIVDDEYLVRERLKICVDWGELGYEIAGEAANGEDALMILEHIPAQLAIVDINMPIIDGLAFAQAAQISHPDLKIVILTGYSSFEYAKTAIQAGVSDYLLKPINMEELLQVLLRLRNRIESDTMQKHQNAHMKMSMVESDSILKRNFLQACMEGEVAERDRDKFRAYCPNLTGDSLFVVVFSIDRIGAERNPLWKRFAAANISNEIFAENRFMHFESTYDEEDRVVLIVGMPEGYSADERLDILSKASAEAVQAIRKFLKFTVTAGIGPGVEDIAGIAVSYKEAVRAIRHKTIYGRDRVILWNELPNKKISDDLSHIRDNMIIQLRLGDAAAIQEQLHKGFETLTANRQPVEMLYSMIYELMATLNIFAAENKVYADADNNDPFNPMRLADELETIDEIEKWVRGEYANVLARASSVKQSTPAKIVGKAKQYIDDNYADSEMDLADIAGSVFVNPSYLSRIFKNELGYSVVEYLTRRRMVKAKELIEQGFKNLYFIAESVGYKDTHYFSKCFKKHFSVSPSKFIAPD
ncbi:response regulator [Cohnella herbarum]|uniref:Response regulator n=1 Tax=Cohnella herbarum TaxID=2728023 RepID=A0A7Z2VLJ3_9BACL|nr:response regulator [Cohnella herbarum]QJD85473.1 response regulator [Cohnella herbarum]